MDKKLFFYTRQHKTLQLFHFYGNTPYFWGKCQSLKKLYLINIPIHFYTLLRSTSQFWLHCFNWEREFPPREGVEG